MTREQWANRNTGVQVTTHGGHTMMTIGPGGGRVWGAPARVRGSRVTGTGNVLRVVHGGPEPRTQRNWEGCSD